MMTALLVFLGSGLGGLTRWALGNVIVERWGSSFPWATLVVNVTGSFMIGVFAGLPGTDARILTTPNVRTFVVVGLCGGYTTFSSFSLQTLNLVQAGDWGRALLNVAGSVFLCLAAVWAGHAFAAGWTSAR